jgi:LPXTG-motif cell wall-anchored protein
VFALSVSDNFCCARASVFGILSRKLSYTWLGAKILFSSVVFFLLFKKKKDMGC